MMIPTVVRTETRRTEAEDDLDDVLAPSTTVGAQPDRDRLRACGYVGRCHAPARTACAFELGGVLARARSSGTAMNCAVLGDRVEVVEEVGHEAEHLGLREGLVLHVDEERAGERRVGAVLRGLGARGDAAVAAVDLERLERVLVLLVVRVAEVAEAALVARDAPGRSCCRPRSRCSRRGSRPPRR